MNYAKDILGTIGGNPLRKGLIYLVEAWQNLKLKNATLLIKTSEAELKKNTELYKKILKDDTINIVSYIKNIENFYLDCDLFCLPSIDDGFGLVVLEAMSVGIPVITTKNVGASEFIKHNVNGFVGEKRDVSFIEDKIFKFADKTRHQIFLEPEGLNDHTIYPNGISTSLPTDVQQEICNNINGLENVKIIRPGYAIEYDYIDPRELFLTLETKKIQNLYLAYYQSQVQKD